MNRTRSRLTAQPARTPPAAPGPVDVPRPAESHRRRASDVVRLGLAALILGLLAVRANEIGSPQLDLLLLLSSLPRGLAPVARVILSLGTLPAVVAVVVAASAAQRWRLARDVLLTGLVGWGVARFIGFLVVGPVTTHAGLRGTLRSVAHTGVTPGFPTVRLAVAVGVIAIAAPYVARPVRRTAQAVAVVLAFAAMYSGLAYPSDLVAGAFLGWGVAALVRLLVGAPAGRPTAAQVAAMLPEIGIDLTSLRPANEQTPDSTVFDGKDHAGPLQVKVIGRDALDAQLLARTWRFLAYKEPEPPLQLSRVQQVEHEACMGLLARSAGVNAPQVMFVGGAGSGAAVLVLRPLAGRRLAELRPSEVDDRLLRTVWQQVGVLHRAGLSHGSLDANHVLVGPAGPGIVSFATAATSGFGHRQPRDVAELLAATAAIVGNQRAVDACRSVLGHAPLLAALPYLQPAVLRPATRTALAGRGREMRRRLDELRQVAADAAGVKPPTLQQVQRIRPARLLLAVSALGAVAILLSRIGNPAEVWAIVSDANWGWLSLALALALATNIGFAVALMGTVDFRLPLWPTSELQLSMSYTNLVIPIVGGTGFQVRFLQRQGAELPAAVAAGSVISLAGTAVTNLPLFGLAVVASPNTLRLGHVPVSGLVKLLVIAVIVVAVGTALIFGIPRLRRTVMPPLREAARTVWQAMRSPRQLALLLGGNVAVALLYGFCLQCCLLAFGDAMSFWTVLALAIGVGSISSVVPLPGAGSAAGAVGLTAALTGLGVPASVAVIAALANQFATNYVPAAFGYVALRDLIKREYV